MSWLGTNCCKASEAGRGWLRMGWILPLAACVWSLACTPVPELVIDVQADVIRLSATVTEDSTAETTTVHANASGGSPPYVYLWTVKNSIGQVQNELLSDRGASDPVFHGGELVGPYLITCAVSDSALRIVTDTTIVYVSQDLGLSLSADRQELPNGGGEVGQAKVEAEVWGGNPPYAYAWSVLGPDGGADDERLSGSGLATRMFTSSQELGTYRIQCKATDATGAFSVQTIDLLVDDLLSAIVSSDRPVITPSGGANGQTWLAARVGGGKAPYSYAWTMFGPDGVSGDWLNQTTGNEVLFTSPAEVGTYRAVCTVTDARGQQAVSSVLVLVSQQLSLSVGTNRQRVAIDGGVAGRAVLSAAVRGGAQPYTYHWIALDPGGSDASASLDDVHSAAPTYTSTAQSGTFRFACEVTDSTGQIAVDSLEILVGEQLIAQLMVTSSAGSVSSSVNPGSEWVPSGGGSAGEAAITAEALGGSPPYFYAWSITGPDGNPADDRLTGTSPHTRFFTSASELGTYRITCKITDVTGLVATDSIKIAVFDNLTLQTTMDHMQLPAGGGPFGIVHLHSIVAGGTAPFTYAWSIVTPAGLTDSRGLSDATAANPTFTSYEVNGIFRANCTVTDSTGQTADDSLLFVVGQGVTLDVTCDRTDVLANGGQAHLHATAHGGIPPYTFSWTCTDPLGVVDTAQLQDYLTADPIFTSALLTGTYSFTCTVTDSAGFVAVLSTSLVVGGGLDQGLSVDVSAGRQSLPISGGKVTLSAVVLGGVPQVSYEWTVTGPSGLVLGTLDDPTSASPEFTAPGVAGTYRLTCTVTDQVLKQFTDTLEIYVGMPLSLDASTNRLSIPAAGGQALLTTHATGGESPFTYAWSVLDPAGNDATSALGIGGDLLANPTFTAPATPGTYQCICTVTDAADTTATACLQMYVGMGLFSVVTATKQSLPSGQTSVISVAGHGGTGSYSYAWTALDPSSADASAQLSSTTLATTTFTAPASAGTYRITCTITDSANATFTQSILLYVGMPLTLDVRTDRLSLPATGQQAQLTASANGGVAGYTYAWTALTPAGADASSQLSATNTATPVFTAPAAPGTYRFTCTVTDTAGNTSVASLQILVGLGLWCDVTATKQSLPSGQTSVITVAGHGGTGSYSYAWTALDPSSADASAQLSSTTLATTTFTAPATAGTYRITCTITDGANATFTQSILIYVGMPLTLDVRTDRLSLPASGQQAQLTASANGGVAGYTYAWTALTPAGADASSQLSATNTATPVFTAPAAPGTYRFTCTVTDTAGNTSVASLQILVGLGLWCDVTATKQSLPSGQTSVITVAGHGGTGSYSYAWTALDPSSADASAQLSSTTLATTTFTAPATAGTYRITCTITDSANATFTQSILLYVGMPLTLDVRTDRLSLPATGQQAQLTASANGGVAGYTYAWTALTPSSADASAQLSATNTATPVFTAPAAPGTYRFTCTVTDTAGNTSVASLQILVGLGLWCDVTATKQSLPSGQTSVLTVAGHGGTGSYSYAWTALDPSSADASAQLSSTTLATTTFTAPATAGTYRITCTITDSANATFTQSILLYVGMPLTLDVRTDRLSLPATGQQAQLIASANGGVAGYTYAWTALTPSSADASAQLSATNTATPVFTAPAAPGTYRFTCTVTDTAGNTSVASLQILVGLGLWCDVTATKQSLPSGQTSVLTVAGHGGTGSYSYAWTALDPSSADASAQLSSTTLATTTFTAPATAGTYRITCTITDSANATFTQSILLYVGMPLTLDVRTDRLSLPATGQQAQLTASANGGVAGYTYAWTALTPAGADASAQLSATNTATPVFTAPAAPGTYRFTCTVTDTAGNTSVASLQVLVGLGLWCDVTATKQSLPSGQTSVITTAGHGGTGSYSYAWTALDPSSADASAQLSSTTLATTTFTAPASAGTYRITCTITDSANATFTQSILLYVGMPLTLDVRTDRLSLPATGQQAQLTASANGGVAGYTYAWTALTPSSADASAQLSATNTATPVFTAPAAPGTYRFTCTVTDTAGNTSVASLQVLVGLGLWCDVTATKQSLPSGQTSVITVAGHGGTGSYSYAWTALDPSSADASAQLSSTTLATTTFTAPATAGTYRITCTITDSANATFTQSILLYVGMPLTLDVRTDRLSLPAAGQQAQLTASANGGVAGYTYAWTALTPSNADASAQLSATNTATPVFTAPAAPGTYRFTCTVTDTAGNTSVASLQILVGLGPWCDITATKQSLPSGQTSVITVAGHGGTGSYSYAWTALDPSSADASAQLSSTTLATTTFTAPASAGTYRITCTITDSANATFTQSILLYVGMPLTLDVRTDRLSLPATGQQAQLTASANGGVAGYTYAWTALTPAGADASAQLSATNTATPVFTAPAAPGTYRFTCTVTDTAGNTSVASLQILVGLGLWCDVTATKQSLPSGQTSVITTAGHGGTGSYSYAWTALDPSSADASAQLSSTTLATTTFTAPATAGTYRITCTITDSANATFTQSILLYVGTPLSLDVTATYTSIPVTSGQTSINASARGGVAGYTYAWSALDQAGGDATAAISDATAASTTFSAALGVGTYRLTCVVTDSAGATSADSIAVQVGMPLSAYLLTTRSAMPATKQATLSASTTGGVAGYTYAWTVLNPSGANVAGTVLDSAVASSPVFTAPATAGTYRVTCTVTDSRAATATAALQLFVGLPLALDVTTTLSSIPAGETATLAANATGGVVAGAYTYAWSVKDSSGADQTLATLGGGAATASPTFTGPATPGTYRATCTVTDDDGYSVSDSVHIQVGMPLSLAVTTTEQTLAAGATATLLASPSGGVPNYTYAWTVLDPTNTDITATPGVLSSATVQSPTFTAPFTSGTYRLSCEVTDASEFTFTGVVHIVVSMHSVTWTTPATADDSSVYSAHAFPASLGQYSVFAVNYDLPQPRNLTVRFNDGGTAVTGTFYIAVDGVSADGHSQTEYFQMSTGLGLSKTGSKPFARVDYARWVRTDSSSTPTAADSLQIGFGNIFGLSESLASSASVRRVVLLPNTILGDHTVVTTLGAQGINLGTSASPPNGARSYQVFFDDD